MILVNGVATDSVAATDRGLAYGDGVFRTLLARPGGLLAWQRHYRKLAHDCAALAIPCPPEPLLAQEVERAADPSDYSVIKIVITRGSGMRGYAPPESPTPTRVVMASPLPAYPREYARDGVKVHWCRTRLSFQLRLAGVKHLNRLENVLARAEWSDPAVPEGLMLDGDGNVVCGTMANLLIVEGGSLVTPELSRCGVAGVTRERVMEAAAARGVAFREEPVSQARLLDAEEALLVNSVIGVWQVRECGGRSWTPGAFAARVREWLDDEAR
ncbi:MAG: aminodeoxychorismate lyase [Betaproteobacteria bacterium]|nr:aminodeoxychorismate lyase [Betaproteobacteria bacterium]